MPRRYYTYGEGSGWGFWNVVVTLGAFFLGASILLFVYNLGKSLKHGETAGNNPWDAATLEWAIPSPPPVYNFAQAADVGHRDPLWWEKYDKHAHGGSRPRPHVGGIAAGPRRMMNEVTGPHPHAEPVLLPAHRRARFFVGALGCSSGHRRSRSACCTCRCSARSASS